MDVFVARQPIFNASKNVVAYEILYRSGFKNEYNAELDGDRATTLVVTDSILNFGLHALTAGKKAYINFTHNLILSDLPLLFKPEELTIEILETVTVDDALIEKCKILKSLGYTIALDDFAGGNLHEKLIPYVDIIKVDFLVLKSEGRKIISDKYKHLHVTLLAEKVETYSDFEEAISFGYELFQGFFFEKPVVCHSKNKAVVAKKYLEVIHETNQDEVDFNRLAEIIKSDVSLTYKLLRLINSPAFYTVSRITSVNHALTLLGIKEVKKWATLIMLRDMSAEKPSELLRTSLVRAVFVESIAVYFHFEHRKQEIFLMGLLSMVDTVMEKPLFDLLDQLPLREDLKEAMIGAENDFHVILKLMKYYEKGNWEMIQRLCDARGLDSSKINVCYKHALAEATRRMEGLIQNC